MRQMTKRLLAAATGIALSVSSASAATAYPPHKHHSMLKGAIVGGMAGHMLGHHGKVGAATGALFQHHRNSTSRY